MSNILIVESKNDKYFIQSLINYLNCKIEVAPPIYIKENDYKPLGGLDKKKLEGAIKEVKAEISKKGIQKVGIIIDIDNHTKEERLKFINDCIGNVFPETQKISNTGEFVDAITQTGDDVKLSCYFTNIDGQGELETVLKTIKNEDSTHADCLEAWKHCIETKGKQIKDKDLNKFWVNMYIRYDTPSIEEKNQAGTKCTIEYVMKNKPNIWDFKHPALNDLKEFLKLFCE